MTWIRNPWGRPRWLALITAMYVLWSVVPVLLAIAFAFNAGRSRTTWQGFSFRWFTGETGSVLHDSALRDALGHTLLLAVACVAIATPLGIALALGLQRWRGRGSGTVNGLMLLPLVTPEIVMGVALLLLFLQIFPGIGLGTEAQIIGQVTFALSYVVVIVRGRLVSIGPEFEEVATYAATAVGTAATRMTSAAARARVEKRRLTGSSPPSGRSAWRPCPERRSCSGP